MELLVSLALNIEFVEDHPNVCWRSFGIAGAGLQLAIVMPSTGCTDRLRS
jgi:hypothetical protein